ncbi:hypothetical protein DY000_02023023 [Brassica cretica]|uniref:Uncharacterized protein n=1 Tax=Brassica cretica TaxID=69181 RepID=A0ABQ7EDP9_BRACR|nr:hypothetical protein DY000_02023023 [Brassica cretica]
MTGVVVVAVIGSQRNRGLQEPRYHEVSQRHPNQRTHPINTPSKSLKSNHQALCYGFDWAGMPKGSGGCGTLMVLRRRRKRIKLWWRHKRESEDVVWLERRDRESHQTQLRFVSISLFYRLLR